MSQIKKFGIIILAAGSSTRLGEPKQLLSYQHKSLLTRTIEAAKNARDAKVVVILGDKHTAIAEDIEPLGVDVIYNAAWEEGMSSSVRVGLSALLKGQTGAGHAAADDVAAPIEDEHEGVAATDDVAAPKVKDEHEGVAATDDVAAPIVKDEHEGVGAADDAAAPIVKDEHEGVAAADHVTAQLEGVILTVCDQPFLTSAVLQALLDEAKLSGKSIVASAYKDTLGTPVFFSRQYFEDLLALKGAQGARMLLKKYEAELASVPFDKGEIDIDTPEDYQKLITQYI
jgi:CTP:molybdopterin cytidylyltransferase MocA